MEYIYIILASLAVYAECSNAIDTRNILHKAGLLLIVTGALLGIEHYPNNLLELGAMMYITVDIYKNLWNKYKNE